MTLPLTTSRAANSDVAPWRTILRQSPSVELSIAARLRPFGLVKQLRFLHRDMVEDRADSGHVFLRLSQLLGDGPVDLCPGARLHTGGHLRLLDRRQSDCRVQEPQLG